MLFFIFSITYSAKNIKFYPKENKVQLIDSAMVQGKDLKVTSDTILYFIDKKKMVATGSPVLYTKDNTIYSDRMEYYLDKKMGMIINGKTKTEKGWFWGDKAYYTEDHSLYILDGKFTTCDKIPPHYFFYSPRMRVEMERDIVASNVFLVVLNIPVFYIPFWMSPAGGKRKSGFLTPSFGFQTYAGRYIKNIGWYQTVGEHADLSMWMDYYTTRGVMPHFEFRFRGPSNASVDLYGEYIREFEGKERWKITGSGGLLLPFNTKGKYSVDYASDKDLNHDYIPGEVSPVMQDATGFIELSKSTKGGNISILLRQKKNLITGESSGELPSIDYSLYGIRFGPISLTGKIPYRRKMDRVNYLYPSSSITISKNLFPLNISAAFRLNTYYASLTADSIPWHGYHYSYSIKLGTRIYGLSKFGLLMFEKFRVVYSPSLSYSFSPEGDSVSLLPSSPFSVPSMSRDLRLSMGILWQTKIGGKKFDIASTNLNTSYSFSEDRFNKISISASSNPIKNLSISFSTAYDPYERSFSSRNVNFNFDGKTKTSNETYSYTIKYSLTFNDSTFYQTADLKTDIPITKKWKGRVSTHYDFQKREFQQTNLSLTRDLHCWKLKFSYNRYGSTWGYNFTLSLIGIPEVKLEKTTIPFLFP